MENDNDFCKKKSICANITKDWRRRKREGKKEGIDEKLTAGWLVPFSSISSPSLVLPHLIFRRLETNNNNHGRLQRKTERN